MDNENRTQVRQQVWVGETPHQCDICHTSFRMDNPMLFVDGKTTVGPWAIMCLTCHNQFGCGTGLGRGQVYKWDGECYVKAGR